jgi:hypothetical protein
MMIHQRQVLIEGTEEEPEWVITSFSAIPKIIFMDVF